MSKKLDRVAREHFVVTQPKTAPTLELARAICAPLPAPQPPAHAVMGTTVQELPWFVDRKRREGTTLFDRHAVTITKVP
jgi:hypothetical protein